MWAQPPQTQAYTCQAQACQATHFPDQPCPDTDAPCTHRHFALHHAKHIETHVQAPYMSGDRLHSDTQALCTCEHRYKCILCAILCVCSLPGVCMTPSIKRACTHVPLLRVSFPMLLLLTHMLTHTHAHTHCMLWHCCEPLHPDMPGTHMRVP